MRKLLNTVYVTNEQSYLTLDGENLVCRVEGEIVLRIPFENIENIVCFNYIGCSPALMGKCVSKSIPINFVSPQGKFLAKICGETKGNVFLRVAQIDKFREDNLRLSQNTMAAKFSNTRQVIKRTMHDNPELRNDADMKRVIEVLSAGIEKADNASSIEEVIGIEGNCAKEYFAVFDKLITNPDVSLKFESRSKHPPLNEINAMLSFVYTLMTSEFASALETVGLDSYIGYCHALRSGRVSLACDLVEEARCLAERFVLTLINLRIINEKDFEKQISGAVYLSEEGRKKLLIKWQGKEKNRT